MRLILPLMAISMLTTSCVVSKKKYETAEFGRLMTQYSRDSLANILKSERDRIERLRQDSTNVVNTLRSTTAKLQESTSQKDELNKLLAQKQHELKDKQSLLTTKTDELDDREKTIRELRSMINEQNEKLKKILNSVKNALTGFNNDQLTTREENGKIYVAMSEKLLFESGKAEVNNIGKQALERLASVLNQRKDIDIWIVGHTDNVPIKTAIFRDNWDLSVIRATSVVRILTQDFGVNPLQIQPCGRGEFNPVDSNETSEGKARNRRTEIIIAPNLDELQKLLQTN